ncbi:alcohol dehydrogenase catalytic domain-containing protein [Amycolatopsis granulosa]|uniref:alcohol dehydrogenase catalytic domain-containing protein n=1 Tax=Amycolatopsis granulosa TaxID=185684 RepID=UPI0014212781|nr:zinc-binding dehydrogenase [Amycolatopsis granulosa]NIH87031.1 NADPH:quinone reductase-like Zn-dependent oxidoreductase [Amycolatopsis granulosa]
MRAVVVEEFGGPEVLKVVDVPVPVPGPAQVRIRVSATTVNPVDLATAAGLFARTGVVPAGRAAIGWDVAGVVEEAGAGVAFAPGEPVIGLRARLTDPQGAWAEQIVLDAAAVAPAPPGIDPVAAATLPLNALTALQALDALNLKTGRTLLVTGAAGGVGGFAVELAALRGLRVVAAAGEHDEEAVRGFGAEFFVPRTEILAEGVRKRVPGGVDGVIDAAVLGYAALDAVRDGGAFAAVIGNGPDNYRGIRIQPVRIAADGTALTGLSRLAAAGHLTLRVAETLPLADAAKAAARFGAGGLRGRLVLVP